MKKRLKLDFKEIFVFGIWISGMSLALGTIVYAENMVTDMRTEYTDLIVQLQSETQLYKETVYAEALNISEQYKIQFSTEKCSIYNGWKYQEKSLVNGLYWHNRDFYCVWAKDRELDAIERTDRHEYCHYLVDNDAEHFCKVNT